MAASSAQRWGLRGWDGGDDDKYEGSVHAQPIKANLPSLSATTPTLEVVGVTNGSEMGTSIRDLRDFLLEAELDHYYSAFKNELKIASVPQIKYALMDKANLTSSPNRTLSPPPDHRISRPISYIRPTGKQIISSDLIEITKTLGEGEFGVVQQGVWTTEEGEKEFLKEAGLMQTIDHDHIVHMFGVVLDKENSLMLRQDFPLLRLCDFAQQISDGMAYLESKRLIHRDLAARNILVFSKDIIKISDFGLSRALGRGKDYYQSNFTINLKLPIAWCAPECINYLKFTSASDVWAFAVTLWEMFTYGCQPWAGLSGQQILDAIDSPNHERLDRPDLCPKNYYDLMLKCWDQNAEHRPTFGEMYILFPQMRPTQVKAVKDFPEVTVPKDYIYYRAYDVISVLDKMPSQPPVPGLWKGALMSGKTGYFDPCNTVPFIEPKSSPDSSTPKKSISRKDSKRSGSKKIRPDMISRPQNDLRHTGHIGYDGAIFGDVGFIGDNYDKLPLKTSSIGKLDDSRNSINLSRMSDSPDKDNKHLSLSDSSLNGGPHRTNGFGRSWISVESLQSTTGRTDERDDRDGYLDIDDDSLLADFKMPDLGSSLDFGGSFMDEVLKALSEKESQLESTNEKSSTGSRGSQEDVFSSGVPARNRSLSPPLTEPRGQPPPLPAGPPRAEAPKPAVKPDGHRLQAKVKPMSTSDERMMEDAINIANEFASHSGRSQMMRQESQNSEHSDAGSESPRLIHRIKASIKKSPKQERQRTFSESLNQEAEEVPAEAQEAYNALVVHGSIKEGSRGYQHKSIADNKRESFDSNGSSGQNFAFADSSSSSVSRTPDRASPIKSISNRSSASPPVVPRVPSRVAAPERPSPVPRPEISAPSLPKRGEPPMPKPRPELVHRVEPTVRSTPPPVPAKDFDRTDYSAKNTPSSHETTSARNNAFEISAPLAISEPEWKRSEESLKSDRNSQTFSDSGKMDSLNTSMDSGQKSNSQSDVSQSSASKFTFFDEEMADPSPREIMSKLARESRLRRSLDHQRGPSGDGETTPNRNLREPQGIPGKTFAAASSGEVEEEVDTNPLRMLRGGVIPVRGGRAGSGMSTNKPTLRHPKLHFTTTQASSSLQHSVSMDSSREIGETVGQHAYPDTDEAESSAPAVPPRSFSICDNSISNNYNNPLPLPQRNPRRTVSLNCKPRERKYPLLLVDSPTNQANASTGVNVYNNAAKPVLRSVTDSQIETADSNNKSHELYGKFDNEDSRFTDMVIKELVSKSEKYKKPYPIPMSENPDVTLNSPSHENISSSRSQLPDIVNNLVVSKEKYRKPFPLPDFNKPKLSSSYSYKLRTPPPTPVEGVQTENLFLLSDFDTSSLANLPLAPAPPSYHVAIAMNDIDADFDDNVFEPATPILQSTKQVNLSSEGGLSGSSTFPRGFRMFGIKNVKCNLEQLGFYDRMDPFWVENVLKISQRSRSKPDEESELESPQMMAMYKCTDGVSYEDLLEFALDREKNGEEIELMQKLFGSDVTREDCREALHDTKDLNKAIKLIKLKQLLSIQLGDASRCKEALLASDWNIQSAADYLLNADGASPTRSGRFTPPSPECVDV
ncbi:ACKL-like protein [Mya arenaria]|uniref:non-specific protein-tyrosine kinase n=1 Tax=Mya arenaria TaxID=6604 RepID=A0ABY7EZU1_MYAAR|nr:ACKL-like protein [Mya arenaria]